MSHGQGKVRERRRRGRNDLISYRLIAMLLVTSKLILSLTPSNRPPYVLCGECTLTAIQVIYIADILEQ